MRTKVEVVKDILKQTIIAVQHLAGESHSAKEVGEYVQSAGAEVELFLKESVFTGRSSDRFFNLIESLTIFGMSAKGINSLHDLRNKYNKFKHDPNVGSSTVESLRVMEDALTALDELSKIGPSSIHEPLIRKYTRILWIAGWDHFTSGDTEVHIMLPYEEGEFILAIDYYNIKWEGWQKIVDRFITERSLVMGTNSFPQNVYSRFQEGDFIDAGVFTGDYRELVIELSKWVNYKHDEELVPILQRKNNSRSILTAILFGTMEVMAQGRYTADVFEFTNRLISEAEFQYGADRNSVYIKPFAIAVAKLIIDLDDVSRASLMGPIWVSLKKFDRLKTEAITNSEDLRILVTQDCELVAVIK